MKSTAINPWPWSLRFGFNQAVLTEGQGRLLHCSGQTAMSSEGKLQHANDMRGQIALALENLEAVLRGADMSLSNVVRLTLYTTDVDALIQNFDVIGARLGAAKAMPTQTMVGVSRLFLPHLMFEIEATAAG